MSKQYTPYKVIEYNDSLDIWTSNEEKFICSVPKATAHKEVEAEKIEFVLNILNNHYRLVSMLDKVVNTKEKDLQKLLDIFDEAEQLLTELKA